MNKYPAPSPKPMPLTSMPDRVDVRDQRDMNLKDGMKTDRPMPINPGRPEEGGK